MCLTSITKIWGVVNLFFFVQIYFLNPFRLCIFMHFNRQCMKWNNACKKVNSLSHCKNSESGNIITITQPPSTSINHNHLFSLFTGLLPTCWKDIHVVCKTYFSVCKCTHVFMCKMHRNREVYKLWTSWICITFIITKKPHCTTWTSTGLTYCWSKVTQHMLYTRCYNKNRYHNIWIIVDTTTAKLL